MQRAERTGLGVSVAGHLGLLALLSLNLMHARPRPPVADTMDVMLTDKVGAVSSAPTPATTPPQAAQAPEVAPVVKDASPPPEAAPAPTPSKPAPPVPAPKPVPAPVPKPVPPAPAKPTPAKPAPPVPAKAAPPMAKPAPPKPEKGKPQATALSDDFLKGIPAAKSQGKGEAPRAAVLSPIQMNGLLGLIASQVKPCYTIPAGGADSTSIVSQVHILLKPDGSIAATPQVVGNSGVTPTNQPYLRQMNEAATRAIQRCAPLKLPPDLYDAWKDLTFNFRPNQMG